MSNWHFCIQSVGKYVSYPKCDEMCTRHTKSQNRKGGFNGLGMGMPAIIGRTREQAGNILETFYRGIRFNADRGHIVLRCRRREPHFRKICPFIVSSISAGCRECHRIQLCCSRTHWHPFSSRGMLEVLGGRPIRVPSTENWMPARRYHT
jgi:hypothetical protein